MVVTGTEQRVYGTLVKRDKFLVVSGFYQWAGYDEDANYIKIYDTSIRLHRIIIVDTTQYGAINGVIPIDSTYDILFVLHEHGITKYINGEKVAGISTPQTFYNPFVYNAAKNVIMLMFSGYRTSSGTYSEPKYMIFDLNLSSSETHILPFREPGSWPFLYEYYQSISPAVVDQNGDIISISHLVFGESPSWIRYDIIQLLTPYNEEYYSDSMHFQLSGYQSLIFNVISGVSNDIIPSYATGNALCHHFRGSIYGIEDTYIYCGHPSAGEAFWYVHTGVNNVKNVTLDNNANAILLSSDYLPSVLSLGMTGYTFSDEYINNRLELPHGPETESLKMIGVYPDDDVTDQTVISINFLNSSSSKYIDGYIVGTLHVTVTKTVNWIIPIVIHYVFAYPIRDKTKIKNKFVGYNTSVIYPTVRMGDNTGLNLYRQTH